MKVTIFGLAGTGTSTIGKALVSELGYSFMSGGDIFREQAKKVGMSIYEYDELVRSDTKYDLDLDDLVRKYGEENDNFIFESRLAWNFIPDSIKIKLVCDENITFERIADREKMIVEEVKSKTLKRAKTIEERYASVYPSLEYPPLDDKFDLIIDTSNLSIEEIVSKIKSFLNLKK